MSKLKNQILVTGGNLGWAIRRGDLIAAKQYRAELTALQLERELQKLCPTLTEAQKLDLILAIQAA